MSKNGFNLIDILMAMIVVGVIFTMTIPVLNKKNTSQNIVSELKEFNDILEQAVTQWKTQILCPYKTGECIKTIKETTSLSPDFNQITKYLNIADKVDKGPSNVFWMPEKTLNYYGNDISDYDFRTNAIRSTYILVNGMIFSVEPDDEGFWIVVDVNGKKPPNRIGKDTFHFTIGYNTGNDINFYARETTRDGICGYGYNGNTAKCDPGNLNPTIENGASPTAYTILNQQIPDFAELSKTIPNFHP